MRKWLQRVSIVGWLGGWLGIFLHFVGIPGYIDDVATWLRWAKVITPPIWFVLSIGLVVSGPLLWTSGWWWPRVLSKVKGRPPQKPDGVINETDEDLENFRACLPHIERCRELVRPFADPFGSINMGLQQVSTEGDKIIELIYELNYLTERLKVLGVRCPDTYGSSDEADSALRIRLRIWSMHLTELVVMVRHNDLTGARRREPLKQSTLDKQDAQF